MSAAESEIERARRFKALYNDPTMQELMEGTLGELFRAWVVTEPRAFEEREALFSTALAIRSLKGRVLAESEAARRRDAEDAIAREEGADVDG